MTSDQRYLDVELRAEVEEARGGMDSLDDRLDAYCIQARLFSNVDIDHGDGSVSGSLAWHMLDADGDERTVTLMPGIHRIKTDLTLPSTMMLDPQVGALIKPDSGISLTVASPEHIIASPKQQIIDATDNTSDPVIFTDSGTVYPEWWHSSGTYAKSVVLANISGGGTLDFTGSTYDLEGLAAIDANLTNDVKWVSSSRQATLTNVLTESFEVPTGISVHFENLKFDTWDKVLRTYFTYDTLTIKDCYFNNVKHAAYIKEAGAYANSSIDRVKIINNEVVNSESGFVIMSKIGSARVSGNHIEDLSASSATYGIAIGDHDDDTGTLQANTKNINVSDNTITTITNSADTGPSIAISVMGTNANIADNVIEDVDCTGAATANVRAIYTKVVSGTITGNTIREINTTDAAIMLKGKIYDEATNPKGDKLIVSNNKIYQSSNTAEFGIGVYGTGVPNVIISNNIIDGAEIGITVGGEGYNVAVKDNIITNCGGRTGMKFIGYLDRSTISNNIINGVTGDSGSSGFGIEITFAAGFAKNLTIRNNDIKIDGLAASTNSIIGISVDTEASSENIRIIDNDIDITHDVADPYGIVIILDDAIDGIYIERNQFYGLPDSDRAITFSYDFGVYDNSDFIANITNYRFIDNFNDTRIVEPAPIVTTQRVFHSIRIILDFSELDGSIGNHAISEISDILQTYNVIITRAWYVVSTVLAGAGADLGFSFPAAADYNIMALEDISTSGTTGLHNTIIDGTFATVLQEGSPADISYNVADAEITSGVLTLFVEYVEYK